MKKNRIASLITILLIYIVATIVAILIYKNLNFSFWINLLIADIGATVFVFMFSCILNNSSVYDPYWSVQPIVIIWLLLLQNELNITKILFLIVITLWGVRLTLNWIYTFKNLEWQDWRYKMLKEKTKKFYPIINFLGIHLVPTLVVYFCTLPAAEVMLSEYNLNAITIISLILSTFAFVMQGVADIQMHKFKKRNGQGFIRDGLWKYSRHPNYLGEILMWWGIAIASLSCMPNKIYCLLGAFLNTMLFLFVSIPMADKRNQKRGDFVQLKKETRMLLPIKK